MKKLILSIALISVSLFAFSYGLINTEEITGDIVAPLSAFSGGAGNVVFISDPVMNPALRKTGESYFIQLGFGGSQLRETRTQYVFDSYDNNIGEKTIYENSYFYGEPYLMAAYIPLASFGVYLGYENLYSKDYNYDKIYRDDYYVTLFSENYQMAGNVNAYFLSVSYKWNGLTIGGNFSIMQGDATTSYSIVYVDPSYVDSTMNVVDQYSGLKGGFALSYEYDDYAATVFYHIPTILTDERSIDIIASDTTFAASELDGFLPTVFGGGFTYTPSNIRPVTLMLEAIYERWSELNGAFAEYNDVIKYHLGIKHKMRKDFSMLYGILYEPYRKNNHIADVGFTLGAGYEINNIEFMLSSQYVQNQYVDSGINYTNRYIKLNADVGITF